MFANRKYEEPSFTKNQKMCDPILVAIENATPWYSIQSWKRDPIQRHISISLLWGSSWIAEIIALIIVVSLFTVASIVSYKSYFCLFVYHNFNRPLNSSWNFSANAMVCLGHVTWKPAGVRYRISDWSEIRSRKNSTGQPKWRFNSSDQEWFWCPKILNSSHTPLRTWCTLMGRRISVRQIPILAPWGPREGFAIALLKR